uniref:Uncharacterized protein n=1 Tax=Pavo cristatus TaxID=9049 RepID=A0A8C9FCM1_PAVCR
RRSKMAAEEQLLSWDVSPKNGKEVFFSRETYEKYSLAPSLLELWNLSNRYILLAKKDVEVLANSSENKQTGNIQATNAVEVEAKTTTDDHPFPEPRLPYPFTSCLSEKEQKTYLYLMTKFSKTPHHFPLNAASQRELLTYLKMKEVVNNEVAEFMKFAQNAAKSCTQDYDSISEDALLYTEELFRACIGHVEKYPEFYTLHEIMSIMGGKFNTQLAFKLEKNLLVMGTARYAKTAFPAMPVQLCTDYKTITSIITPEKKASILHNVSSIFIVISVAHLGEKSHFIFVAALFHHFHLNLTHPDNKAAKVVFIDSPLLKKEMTIRERNQIFHEIPVDFLATKKSYVSVSDVLMDKPAEDSLFQWDVCSFTSFLEGEKHQQKNPV